MIFTFTCRDLSGAFNHKNGSIVLGIYRGFASRKVKSPRYSLAPWLQMTDALGLSLPRKGVVRLTDRLDMTIVVDWDVKQQQNIKWVQKLKVLNVAF